jgi:hypothetical protein
MSQADFSDIVRSIRSSSYEKNIKIIASGGITFQSAPRYIADGADFVAIGKDMENGTWTEEI